jgi:hypothetical protein
MAPASAVPLKAALRLLVRASITAPSTRLTAATGDAAGAVASTATSRTADVALVLPEPSVTVVV